MHKFLLFLLPILVLSCISNEYEFQIQTEAEILGSTTECIGLKFEIYDNQVLQDICGLNVAEVSYFTNNTKIPIKVTVRGDDMDGADRLFISIYHHGKQLLKDERIEDSISMKTFMKRHIEIPGFIWNTYNENKYEPGISSAELLKKIEKDEIEIPEESAKKGTKQPKSEGKRL
jgi:hypothetical protein